MFSPRISASCGKALLLEQAQSLGSFHRYCSACLHHFAVCASEVCVAGMREQAQLQSASGTAPVADLCPQTRHAQIVRREKIGNGIQFLVGRSGGVFDAAEINERE